VIAVGLRIKKVRAKLGSLKLKILGKGGRL